MPGTRHSLKTIYFEGELLPDWAQLLDLAAKLVTVPEETRDWFGRFTNSNGVDDSRTILVHGEALRASLREEKAKVLAALAPGSSDSRPDIILEAWFYTLDTMLQQATLRKTCTWLVEGSDAVAPGEFGDGDVNLRRV